MSDRRMKPLSPEDRYRVRYKRDDDEEMEQARVSWGSNDDPRELLVDGEEYEVVGEDVRSWHTKLELAGHEGKRFNSAHFESAEQADEANP